MVSQRASWELSMESLYDFAPGPIAARAEVARPMGLRVHSRGRRPLEDREVPPIAGHRAFACFRSFAILFLNITASSNIANELL